MLSLRRSDSGPVRTRVTRTAAAGPNTFTQHLDIYGALGEIRVTTEMVLRAQNVFVGVSLPTPPGTRLTVDIPFGVEPRDPARVPYGKLSDVGYENIERRIPRYFWGRSWVDASDAAGGCALVSEDGDRFFRQHASGAWIVHFCQKVPPDSPVNWEARSQTAPALGRHVYHHVLIPHGPDVDAAELVRRAEAIRAPALWRAVRLPGGAAPESWLAVRPACVRLSAFCRDGEATVLRIYNPTPRRVRAKVTLPARPRRATRTDFAGKPLRGKPRLSKQTLACELRPWQIATFRLAFS